MKASEIPPSSFRRPIKSVSLFSKAPSGRFLSDQRACSHSSAFEYEYKQEFFIVNALRPFDVESAGFTGSVLLELSWIEIDENKN